jgi:hypothetical protein
VIGPGRVSPAREVTGWRVRTAAAWFLRWLFVTTAIGTGLVAWTLANGGEVHRTVVCGGRADANFYDLSIRSGVTAVIVLGFLTLATRSILWRWAQIALVTVIGVAFTMLLSNLQFFTAGCT